MNAYRPQITVVLFLVGLCAVMWVAGALYFVTNGLNPFGQVGLLTWFDYWQGSAPAIRQQLLKSLVMAVGVTSLPVILGAMTVIRNRNPLHGQSGFASIREIRKAGLMDSAGIIVGKTGKRFLTFGTMQFVSLFAALRTGKGVGIVVPNLLNFPKSVVVLDIKLENFQITSKYRQANGQDVYCYSPFSLTTHQQNALGYLSDNENERITEILSIGYIVYPRVGGETMWNDSARNLFMGLVLYLCETPDLPVTMGEVLRQSSGKGQTLQKYLQAIIWERNYDAVPDVDRKGEPTIRYVPKPPFEGVGLKPLSDSCVDALRRFIASPERTAGSILTTFEAPLTVWVSPIVDAASSTNSFDLRDLRKRKMTVYIGIPANKLAESEILIRLFFTQLVNLNTDVLLAQSTLYKHECLLLLDEFLAAGYMQIFDKAASYMAGYGLRMLTIAQSTGLASRPVNQGGYGREGAKALFDMHALKILFTPKDINDANEYSAVLGYDTVKSRSTKLFDRLSGTESDQRRALMLPQELMRMSLKKQLIQLDGVKPIMCDKIRFYRERVFIDRLKSVSPTLAKLGRKLPTQKQLEAVWGSGELSAPVPTTDIELHQAKANNRTRPMTVDDAEGDFELNSVALDFSDVPVPSGDPLTDEDISAYVNGFWSAIEGENTIEQADDLGGKVDRDTGEWTPPPSHLIDMSVLNAG